MQLVPEIGIAQLSKKGEELCGDAVEVIRTADNTVLVLSDGLGSGVKANILSTLTTKIAAKMISENVPVEDVVKTIIQTLPTCKVRQLAYSTFTILKISKTGKVHLVEYDGPPVLRIKQDQVKPVQTENKEIDGRVIREANFALAENEVLVVVSDGVTQAGLGGILPLGLGVDGLIRCLKKDVDITRNTQEVANQLIELCEVFYAQEAGDDTTAVAICLRRSKEAVVFTGPPKNQSRDKEAVRYLMEHGDVKIVCGGTTAKIVAREIARPLKVDFSYVNPDVPPIAKIEGIDLVTEGILTLTKGLEILDNNSAKFVSTDGSNLLVKQLLNCDKIKFIVGTQINPAHQNPELPLPLGLRKSIIEKWQKKLEARGKIVDIIWF